MTAYGAYYNLTAGNHIYVTDPTTGIVTDDPRFSHTSSSPSNKQSSSRLSRFLDQFKPIEDPLPPTRIYEPVMRRPLFGRSKPDNSTTSLDKKLWEAGKGAGQQQLKRRGSDATLVEEDQGLLKEKEGYEVRVERD